VHTTKVVVEPPRQHVWYVHSSHHGLLTDSTVTLKALSALPLTVSRQRLSSHSCLNRVKVVERGRGRTDTERKQGRRKLAAKGGAAIVNRSRAHVHLRV